MTKTKSLLTYLLTNSVFATCVYFGAVQGIPGFMNVVTFFIWFVFVVFVLGAFNDEAAIKMYLIRFLVLVILSVKTVNKVYKFFEKFGSE